MKTEKYSSISDWLTISEEPKEPLLITRFREKGFGDDQILNILHVLDNTCECCYDADHDCRCWDE